MTTKSAPQEPPLYHTIEDYKEQNDHYWAIIEKQRLIIKSMQKSINQLTSENEILQKRNKELESLAHSSSSETNNKANKADSASSSSSSSSSTPAVPPRSPYRVHHNTTQHHPFDIYMTQTPSVITNLPKRPPVLKLAMSNYARTGNGPKEAFDLTPTSAIKETLLSPGRFQGSLSNPSSPQSVTSTSSGMTADRADLDPLSPLGSKHQQLRSPTFLQRHPAESGMDATAATSPREDKKTASSHYHHHHHHKRNHSQSAGLHPNELESLNQKSNSNNNNNNKCKSEPSTPAHPRTPRYDSLAESGVAATTVLKSLSNISVKIISSSTDTDEKGLEAYNFLIGIFQRDDDSEIWKIEKSLSELVQLDSNLRKTSSIMAASLKKLPDKSMFATHAPTKVDERKNMVQDYLQQAISLKSGQVDILCEFLSTDKVHHLPITFTNDAGSKQGYLTKKGKNFGAWKSRYFILDQSGMLRYYESKNGAFLGNINLHNSKISPGVHNESDTIDASSSYRHAFVIEEPRSSGSYSKHIFCADSDAERDAWIDALRFYTNQFHFTDENLGPDAAAIDHLIVEPSSSTESTRGPSLLRKRPSIDYILNYFQQSNSGRRRSSSNKGSSNISLDSSSSTSTTSSESSMSTVAEDGPLVIAPPPPLDESVKHLKHRSHRKTFWSKKIFNSMGSPTTLGSGGDTLHPMLSPHGITFSGPYDLRNLGAMSDYEETCGQKQIFGVPLEDAVSVARVCDQYDLPAIVHRCIEYLETRDALTEEGIYRLSGSSAKVKTLKKRFNSIGDVKLLEDEEFHDVHAIAGLLKMWLRELPENILTEALLGDFLSSARMEEKQDRKCQVGKLISTLPIVNYTLLRSLCAHLIRVVENSDKNRMTLRNISIVFSATLAIPSSIFDMLLTDFDYIFWTDRCSDTQVTEDTIKNYIRESNDEPIAPNEQQQYTPLPQKAADYLHSIDSSAGRSSRNSIHYKDNTPKEFISLEKQLDAVLNDDTTFNDDMSCYSDEELEVAYFATRYNANSRSAKNIPEEVRTAI